MKRKMTDRMLLESLLNKYGVKKITNVINKINEAKRSLWCGIPDVYMIWHGQWADPEVEYNGYRCSEWDIQDSMFQYMKEKIADGENWGDPNNDDDFCKFCKAHAASVKQDIIEFAGGDLNESFHINENQDDIQVLFNDLPEADDDYRQAYEEDVEVGDVDPEEEDYYEYLSRMRDIEVEDLEDNINIADGKYGYYYTVCKNPDDNSVSNDLWDAIYALVSGEYCKISFVNDHIEVEVAHYNSQNRSYYKIYALNQKGCDLYEEDEDVYYGHDMAKLNNPKYFRRMEPIM